MFLDEAALASPRRSAFDHDSKPIVVLFLIINQDGPPRLAGTIHDAELAAGGMGAGQGLGRLHIGEGNPARARPVVAFGVIFLPDLHAELFPAVILCLDGVDEGLDLRPGGGVVR